MNEAVSQAKAAIEREDYALALHLLHPLADAGHAEAQFLMGYLYFTSAEVGKDDSKVWLERAAVQAHPEAVYYLACLGDRFDFGPPEDAQHAALLLRAAELGSVQAQRDLGCCYATGEQVFPKDLTLARLWYGRAAEAGHADAQYNFGCMLLYAEGGPEEPEAGLAWVHRAAEQGDAAALHHLRNIAAGYS